MIQRWQKTTVISALKARRVVHLTGARQTGKTTLAKSLELEHSRHTTLDKALYLKAAQDDAAGFLIRSPGETVIIDEVQKVPALLDEIKIQVAGSEEILTYTIRQYCDQILADEKHSQYHTLVKHSTTRLPCSRHCMP